MSNQFDLWMLGEGSVFQRPSLLRGQERQVIFLATSKRSLVGSAVVLRSGIGALADAST